MRWSAVMSEGAVGNGIAVLEAGRLEGPVQWTGRTHSIVFWVSAKLSFEDIVSEYNWDHLTSSKIRNYSKECEEKCVGRLPDLSISKVRS